MFFNWFLAVTLPVNVIAVNFPRHVNCQQCLPSLSTCVSCRGGGTIAICFIGNCYILILFYFYTLEFILHFFGQIAKLQALDFESRHLRWVDEFGICSIVEGKVHEIKDFGIVISFEGYNDIYGFISHHHCKSLF